MTFQLNAAARIAQVRMTAAFSDEQKAALAQHIIPLLDTCHREYYYNVKTWANEYLTTKINQKIWDTPKQVDALYTFLIHVDRIRSIVDAVLSKGSPAKRAAELKRSLKEAQKAFRGKPGEDLNKLINKALLLWKKVPAKELTPKGKEIATALADPYFTLLKKSWPYIVKECENEFGEILKQNGLTVVKDGSSDAKIFETLQKVLKGWSFETKKHTYSYGNQEHFDYIAISPDGLTRIELGERYGSREGYSLRPAYRMAQDKGWFSWARTGVDDGGVSFGSETPLEYAVEQMLEKVEKARAARQEKETNGVNFNFGPKSVLMMPDDLQKAVDKIKMGGTYSIEPSGFGIAYVFSKRGDRWSKPASQELSEKVGAPVFYYQADRD